MVSETRKLHLIEEVLKIKSDKLLQDIEALINSKKQSKEKKKSSALEFSGIISDEDAKLMETAIEEGCEQIHPDDWK